MGYVWEQRKATEIFRPIVEKNHEDERVLSVTQNNGVVFRDELLIDIKFDPTTLVNYKLIRPNDFVISLRSFQGGFEISDKRGICSPAYTVFEVIDVGNSAYSFWEYKFKTYKFIESLKTVTFGIRDGKSISFKEFSSLILYFPNSKIEQDKIGTIFDEVSKLIASNQLQLN